MEGAAQVARVRAYLRVLENKGRCLPLSAGHYDWAPDWIKISTATRIPLRTLSKARTSAGSVVAQAFAAMKESGKVPSFDAERATADRVRHVIARQTWVGSINAYADALRAEGKRVPRHPHNPNRPDLGKIAAATNVPEGWLSDVRSVGGAKVAALVEALGIETVTKDVNLRATRTYGALESFGENLRASELQLLAELEGVEKRKNDDGQLRNTQSALRAFRRCQQKEKDDIVGDELGADFDAALASSVEYNGFAGGKHGVEMRRWRSYAAKMLAADGLPEDGIDAVLHLMELNNISFNTLQISLGLESADVAALKTWLTKKSVPSRFQAPIFSAIEQLFDVPTGTLTDRVLFHKKTVRPISAKLFPVDFQQHMRGLVRPHLPENFSMLAEPERDAIAREMLTEMTETDIDYRTQQRVATRSIYSLKWKNGFFTRNMHDGGPNMFCDRLTREWLEMAEFKTSADEIMSPLTQEEMDRHGVWSEATEVMRRTTISRCFGAAALPVSMGGLSLAPEKMTLALLAMPGFVRWQRKWYENRRGKSTNTEGFLRTLTTDLMNPVTGWLAQRSDLMATFPTFGPGDPIAEHVSSEKIAEASLNWSKWCKRRYRKYHKAMKHHELNPHPKNRDPWEPIRSILDHASPMSLVAGVGPDLRANLPSRWLNPFQWAFQLQNSLLWDITLDTRLRAKNLSGITIDPKSPNALRRQDDGTYVVSVHGSQFKNHKGGLFKRNGAYITIVFQLDAKLTPFIDLYLDEARPILLDGRVGDSFFVRRNIRGVTRINVEPDDLSLRIKKMSKAVAYNRKTGTGIPGVSPFGSNAFRDIGATHCLKNGGSWEDAALMLTDTVAVIQKHYASFSPTDHLKKIVHFSASVRRAEDFPERFWNVAVAA